MGLGLARGDESACHPERSEGSAVPVHCELMQILRFAQNDRLSTERSKASLQWLLIPPLTTTAGILRFAQDDRS